MIALKSQLFCSHSTQFRIFSPFSSQVAASDDGYLEEKRPKVDQKHLRSRTQVKYIPGSSVLEHKCVICQTKERWMTKKGKRVCDHLMQTEPLNAGNYYTKFTSFYSLKMWSCKSLFWNSEDVSLQYFMDGGRPLTFFFAVKFLSFNAMFILAMQENKVCYILVFMLKFTLI